MAPMSFIRTEQKWTSSPHKFEETVSIITNGNIHAQDYVEQGNQLPAAVMSWGHYRHYSEQGCQVKSTQSVATARGNTAGIRASRKPGWKAGRVGIEFPEAWQPGHRRLSSLPSHTFSARVESSSPFHPVLSGNTPSSLTSITPRLAVRFVCLLQTPSYTPTRMMQFKRSKKRLLWFESYTSKNGFTKVTVRLKIIMWF
jgi:hypothetical protein